MRSSTKRRLLAALVATLVGCGGGGGGGGAPVDQLGVTKGTITAFGSIIVNGVEYETDNGTAYDVDDNPAAPQSDLKVGQVVTVHWSSADENVTFRANNVIYDDSVEGPITAGSINVVLKSFDVLGQTVLVDADTSFDSGVLPSDIDGLADGDVVKVSGLLDGTGVVRATRVERRAAGGEFEIRGIVAGRTATTFTINGQVVNYAGAMLSGFTVIADDDVVEAKGVALNGAGELVATRVELESDDQAVGESGDDAEVEGYVTSFSSAASFSVAGRPVTTDGTTIVTGGLVALNAKVKVDGEFDDAGVIVADDVTVRTGSSGAAVNVQLSSVLDAVDVPARQVVVLGITVTVDDLTRLEDQRDALRPFSLADLRAGATPDYVTIRGIVQPNGSVRATVLQRESSRPEGMLRGPVTLVDAANLAFTVLAVSVGTDDITSFEDEFGEFLDSTDFFQFVAPGDVVKVRFVRNEAGAPSVPVTAYKVERD